jgi:calpain-15
MILSLSLSSDLLMHIFLQKSRKEIEECCSSFKASFIDTIFPPTDDSLYLVDPPVPARALGGKKGKKKPIITWRRPIEFLPAGEEIKLFDGEIEPNDIKQGALGDCWLMCSLSAIAEFPTLVTDIFLEDFREYNPYGYPFFISH